MQLRGAARGCSAQLLVAALALAVAVVVAETADVYVGADAE